MTVNSTAPRNFTPGFTLDDFVAKSNEAGKSGRVVLSQTDSGETQLVVAKKSFHDRVVSFFKNFPILKGTDAVKKYIKNIEASNKLAHALLASAIARKYGADAATVALDSSILKNIPLNQRTIKQIKKVAESYYGLGAARNDSRNVAINLWPYESIKKGGHASITIDNKDTKQTEHVSWWSDNSFAKEASEKMIFKIATIIDKITSDKYKLEGKVTDKFAKSLASYEVDKDYEIDTGDEKIIKGEEARREIRNRQISGTWTLSNISPSEAPAELDKLKALAKANPENAIAILKDAADLQLLIDSKNIPRPTQIQDRETGKWGTIAQKIYFPMVGKSTANGQGKNPQSKFVMFGLSEKSILTNARDVKANAEAYIELQQARANLNDPKKVNEWIKSFYEKKQEIADLKFSILEKNNEIQKVKTPEFEQKRGILESQIKNFQGQLEVLDKNNQKDELKIRKISGSLEKTEKTLATHIEPFTKLQDLEEKLSDAESKLKEIEDSSLINKLKNAEAKAEKAGDEIGYSFASDKNNCASMAINVLRAGGAENYVAMPKMTTMGMSMIKPDEQFANYAKSVQKEMDKLNNKADFVLAKLAERAPTAENEIISAQEIEEFKNVYSSAWGVLSSSEESNSQKILDIISKNLPTDADDVTSLNVKTKNMVIAAEEFYKNSIGDNKPSHIEKEIETLLHKAFNLHKQNIVRLNSPE